MTIFFLLTIGRRANPAGLFILPRNRESKVHATALIPRAGCQTASGETSARDDVIRLHWRLPSDALFPEAIPLWSTAAPSATVRAEETS